MARSTKLAFLIQRAGYKSENPKLALAHAIASQTADLHLEGGDMVVPVVAFVGEGVFNCLKGQRALEVYGITSLESHLQNTLLCGLEVLVCEEDLARFGLTGADLASASALGEDAAVRVAPWETIRARLESADHLLFF